jgi:CheY-like chemotaxis protein
MRKVVLELSHSTAEPPHVVIADADKLQQILLNLLINAAKFTSPKGRIELSLRNEDGELEIVVADNGMGIEAAELPRVFEMFVQLGQGGEGSGGLGLGLALVKSLVELHGGHVEARSAGRGKGAEFVVRLPLAAAPVEISATLTATASTPTLRRVLVVDDNEDAARTMGALLAAQGHEVGVFFNAREALAFAAASLPDVAFLDLTMPVLDGFALAQKLRLLPGGQAIRLVAVTGLGRKEDQVRSQEAEHCQADHGDDDAETGQPEVEIGFRVELSRDQRLNVLVDERDEGPHDPDRDDDRCSHHHACEEPVAQHCQKTALERRGLRGPGRGHG